MSGLAGLVLAGGRSSRMQSYKAALAWHGRPELARAYELVAARVGQAFVSVRSEQCADPLRAAFPLVVDGAAGAGPIAGIAAAQARLPDATWLVVACDLPLLDGETLDQLLGGRDRNRLATAFASARDGLPEPLCALYEPASREPILRWIAAGESCPRRFLSRHDTALLQLDRPLALENANTPDDAAALSRRIDRAGAP